MTMQPPQADAQIEGALIGMTVHLTHSQRQSSASV
jgi:hypothetical protein